MTERLQISFAPLSQGGEPCTVMLAGADAALSQHGRQLDSKSERALSRAATAAGFTGKRRSSIEILAPAGVPQTRVILLGLGEKEGSGDQDWINLGGVAYAQITQRRTSAASLIVEFPDKSGHHGPRAAGEIAADLALGALLRSYAFRKYRSKPAEDSNGAEERDGLARLSVHTADPDAARESFERHKAVADGVFLARDLVNEPANVLGPVEFAERAAELGADGIEIEVLDVPALTALKMRALLGVAQGSERPARVVVMQWHGAKSKRAKPVCFVGKGVVFDTGGISIKPAAGMEDMKGDMAGAACVTGLMLALARRKAHVNAVGLIGLVENMNSGTAQRPGDIVTSMSGQTIEVLNTDAEGRLVLADVLWYAQERFKPRLIVDLATLTGAIMVALGKEHAGLFSNDDKLAGELSEAGEAVGEKVWRMPLGAAYDKLIDSRNADMKNIGGRFGGAITAAQFLQRFIKDTPWAHLDVAGTAMDSNKTDTSQGWASGWGVRLLDRLVADKYEKAEK